MLEGGLHAMGNIVCLLMMKKKIEPTINDTDLITSPLHSFFLISLKFHWVAAIASENVC